MDIFRPARFRPLPLRAPRVEALSRGRKQRLARIGRILDTPKPQQFNPAEWQGIQAELVDREIEALERGMAYASTVPRMARIVAPVQERLAPVRGRFDHTYRVKIHLVDAVSGDDRWATLTFNASVPEGTDRFREALAKYVREDAFAEQRVDDEGYLAVSEYLEDYLVVRRDNLEVRRDVVSLADVPGFASELTVMNVAGRVRPAEVEFKEMCGYQLLQEDLGLSVEAVEGIVCKTRDQGLTPDDMVAIFTAQDLALIVADTQGVEIARYSPLTARSSNDRRPTVYILGGAHWIRPLEVFADRVRRSRASEHVALVEGKEVADEVKREIAVVAVESLADAIAREDEFKQDLRMPPLQFNAERARRKAELAKWLKDNGVSFTGRRRALQPPEAVARWNQSKAEQRAMLNEWIDANQPRRRDDPAPRRIYYIPTVNDLTPIWSEEIANKRLYDHTKLNGNQIVKFALTPNATLIVDNDMEARRSTFNDLWRDAIFTGQNWASIGGAYLRECFKGVSMPVSTPNALVGGIIGDTSCGGIYLELEPNAPAEWTVHAVDVKRQYASLLRKGGFYTVDIGNDLEAVKRCDDVFLNDDVRTDRIYFVVAPRDTLCAKFLLEQGVVDYELLSAYYEYLGRDQRAILDCVAGYIPINHAPEADRLYREFVDNVYARVQNDTARKRLVNFAIGLMVNGGARSREYVYHTDDRTTAHFYFNTINAPQSNKRITSMAGYVKEDGTTAPVYTIKGRSESRKLTTQILANRAIVQRGKAQMIRAYTTAMRAGALVVSIKVDSITYATETPCAIFETPEVPDLGEWRTCEPVMGGSLRRVERHSQIDFEEKGIEDAKQIEDGRLTCSKVRDFLVDCERWYVEDIERPTITPYDIIGDLRLPKKKMGDEEFALAKEAYKRAHGIDWIPEDVLEWERENARELGEELQPAYIPFEDTLEKQQDPHLLRALILGDAGTGKSFTANALSTELTSRGFRVFRGAYTYCASELVNGNTLHSILGMSINGDCTSSRLAHVLANYDAGIIDEVSMIDANVWRVLSKLPREFPLYLFGDFGQLQSIDKTLWGADTQTLRAICGYRRIVLTKQWRSKPAFVGAVKAHARKMNKRKNIKSEDKARKTLPEQVRDGAGLTIADQSTMLNIFARNAPRKAKNIEIVEHLAEERKDAITIPLMKRQIEMDYDFIEYPDMAQLADIYRTSRNPDEKHALNAYLSRARLYGKKNKRWGVAIKYKESRCGRFFAMGRMGIQDMSREVRARACRNYLDIDFKNSGATILSQAMRKLGVPCPALDDYCVNRESTLTALIGTSATAYRARKLLNREMAKEAIICLINGGVVKHGGSVILQNIARDIQGLWRVLKATPKYIAWLTDTVNENMRRDKMTAKMSKRYLETCRDKWKLKKHRETYCLDYCLENDSMLGAYVANMIYKIEARMLNVMVSAIRRKNKHASTVLCFDGAMFEGLTAEDVDLPAVEAEILKRTGYQISLAFKAVHDGSPLPEVAPFVGHESAPCSREDCRCLDINFDEFPAVFVGLPVLMTTTRKLSPDQKLTNNSAHEITAIEADTVELTSARDGSKARLSFEELAKWTRPAYCRTDYKVQGLTHHGGVLLHQYFEKNKRGGYLLTENSRYTSMTRASDPEKVYVI